MCDKPGACRTSQRRNFKRGEAVLAAQSEINPKGECKVTWSFRPALEAFDQFRDQWDALNAQQNRHILLDSGFVAILLRHSGSRDVVLAVNEDTGNPAMALLERKAQGIWVTFQPSWAPLGLF